TPAPGARRKRSGLSDPHFPPRRLCAAAASYRGRAWALRFLTVASGTTFAVHWLSACGVDHKPGDPYPAAVAPAPTVWVAPRYRWHCSAWIRTLILGLDVMRLQSGTLAALGRAAYFSLLAAFHIGWRDLNVGTWIALIQPQRVRASRPRLGSRCFRLF